MSLLNAGQGLRQLATPPSSNPSPPSILLPNETRAIPSRPAITEPSMAPTTRPASVPEWGSFDIVPGFPVSTDEADAILNLYRSEYSPKFPFVPIAPEVTAIGLFESRPFLFRVIVQMIAPQGAGTQREVAQWIRQHIAKHVVTQQERQIELLQGLLLYIAWWVPGIQNAERLLTGGNILGRTSLTSVSIMEAQLCSTS